MSYAGNGLGITLEGKRTYNFNFRTTPFTNLNEGVINFLPPVSRFNTYRLTGRYVAAPQEIGERAFLIDLNYSPSRTWRFHANASTIDDLNDTRLYQELYSSVAYRYERTWTLTGGLQLQQYNQERYEGKSDVPLLTTVTTFAEFQYKVDKRKSWRAELQYMNTEQDFGSWLFGLLEFSLAPTWTFTVSDMYNIDPKKTAKSIHFPRLDVFYTKKCQPLFIELHQASGRSGLFWWHLPLGACFFRHQIFCGHPILIINSSDNEKDKVCYRPTLLPINGLF
ncbi:MAG: hypothetical protein HC912_07350 [Saprospiraceae bacterium]|nr:hypothetical protein [Saprospiraceae bacterium]